MKKQFNEVAARKQTLERQLGKLKELVLEKDKLGSIKETHILENKLLYFDLEDEYTRSLGLKGFNPGQKPFFDAFNKYKIVFEDGKEFTVHEYSVYCISGGNQQGKSFYMVMMALSILFGEFLWLPKDHPDKKLKFTHNQPREVVVVGQNWEDHVNAQIVPMIEKLWPASRKVETRAGHHVSKQVWIDVRTKSRLILKSSLQDTKEHESSTNDAVFYDEPLPKPLREANRRGLIARHGVEFFGMTMLNSEPWIEDIIEARYPDGSHNPSIFSRVNIQDVNIGWGLTLEGVEKFSSEMDEDVRNARRYGIPIYKSGIIYKDFKKDIHIKEYDRIPEHWLVTIAIDYHPQKEWGVLFLAHDDTGIKHCVDEMYENGSWRDICERILNKIHDNGYRADPKIIIDPLARGSVQADVNVESVFTKMNDYFAAYGYYLQVASKNRESGIKLVQDLLMSKNKIACLYFSSKLPRALLEVRKYQWDIDKNTGKPMGIPLKKFDDLMECLYRLVLEDTMWYPPNTYEEDFVEKKENKNYVTGY